MSPVVFALGVASWLASVPVQLHPTEWRPPTPIPQAPQSVSPTYDRVLVRAVTGDELDVKNRHDFEVRLQNYVKKIPSQNQTFHENLVWEPKDKGTHTHLGYCTSFVKSAYAACGIWLPGSTAASLQSFGKSIGRSERYEIGDLIFVGSMSSQTVDHIGIYLGDGLWTHPGHPDLPAKLSNLPAAGFHIMSIKRLVSA